MSKLYNLIVIILITIVVILGFMISNANAMGYDQLDHYFFGMSLNAGLERAGISLRDRTFIIVAMGICKESYDRSNGGLFNNEDIYASLLGVLTWEITRDLSLEYKNRSFKIEYRVDI